MPSHDDREAIRCDACGQKISDHLMTHYVGAGLSRRALHPGCCECAWRDAA